MRSGWLIGLGILCGLGLAGPGEAATKVVQVMGPTTYAFSPAVLNITVGDTVLWTNVSSAAHDISEGSIATGLVTNSPDWSRISLGLLGKGSVTFSNIGSYPYLCNQHVYVTPMPATNPTQTGQVNVAAFNFPPDVTLTAPSAGTTLLEPASVTLSATATDRDGTVTNIQLFLGSNLVGEGAASPLEATVNGLPGGNYVLTAKAIDNLGQTNVSASVTLVVNYRVDYFTASFSPPTLKIKPGESVLFTNLSGFHTVTGTGAEPFCGSVATSIPFCLTTFNTAGSFPFRCLFHSISQASGMTGTVAVATFNRPPLVTIVNPPSDVTLSAGSSITLQAKTLDPDGSASVVQFINGTSLLFSDNLAPFAFTMTNLAAGVYTITARTADNLGSRATSAPVTITVVVPIEVRLSAPTVGAAGFQFNYSAVLGQQYVVEGSSTLDGPAPFVPLATNVATTTNPLFIDATLPPPPNRAYRVLKSP